MDFLFFGTPAWQLIMQSDWMTKLNLCILAIVSVLCGAVIVNKWLLLALRRKELNDCMQKLSGVRNYQQLTDIAGVFAPTLGGMVIQKIMTEAQLLQVNGRLTERDLEHIAMVSEHAVGDLVSELEEYLPLLSISGSVATLGGLFGTVWGLIHAFLNISQEKSADISVVAPGIAEALITTLAGLVVAIPALIFFYYFSNELRKMERQLFVIADRAQSIVGQTFLP